MDTLGRQMIKARSKAGLSRNDVTEELEIPYRTLQYWELDKRTPPPYVIKMLFKFYEAEAAKTSDRSE